jgi:hypothetical protein
VLKVVGLTTAVPAGAGLVAAGVPAVTGVPDCCRDGIGLGAGVGEGLASGSSFGLIVSVGFGAFPSEGRPRKDRCGGGIIGGVASTFICGSFFGLPTLNFGLSTLYSGGNSESN